MSTLTTHHIDDHHVTWDGAEIRTCVSCVGNGVDFGIVGEATTIDGESVEARIDTKLTPAHARRLAVDLLIRADQSESLR